MLEQRFSAFLDNDLVFDFFSPIHTTDLSLANLFVNQA